MNRKMGWTQSRSGRFGEESYLLILPRIEFRLLSSAVHSLVTIHTELPHLWPKQLPDVKEKGVQGRGEMRITFSILSVNLGVETNWEPHREDNIKTDSWTALWICRLPNWLYCELCTSRIHTCCFQSARKELQYAYFVLKVEFCYRSRTVNQVMVVS